MTSFLVNCRSASLALMLIFGTACTTVAAPIDPLVELGDAEAAGDSAKVISLSRALLRDNTALQAANAGFDGDLRIDLAEALIAQGALADALAGYDAALAAHNAKAPDDFVTEIDLRTRIAELAIDLGNKPRAEDEISEAVKRVRTHLGDLHSRLSPLLSLAIEAELDTVRIADASGLTAKNLTVAQALEMSSSDKIITARSAPKRTRSLGTSRPKDGASFDLVKVFYATSRAPKAANRFIRTQLQAPSAQTYYGAKRGALSTGTVMVSVPRNRELGEIPKPSALRFEFRPDPAKHTILGDISIYDGLDTFTAQLKAEIARSQRKEAFIFIHGYNNSFPMAVERTAQLAIDLEIDGAPLMYSWPSAGSVFSYRADRQQIVPETIEDLKTFLTLVANQSGAERLHIIAHSMGNEFLLGALQSLAEGSADAPLFEQIVFASPDVDADEFAAGLSRLTGLASHLTLYASSKDNALKASRRFNRSGRRAGESDEPLILDGLATIDTTVASVGGLGHADLFGPAFTDFQAMVWHDFEPRERCLLSERPVDAGVAWVFGKPRTDYCGETEFSTAITTLRRIGPANTVGELENLIGQAEARKDPVVERWRAALRIVQMVQ